ncbi:MAG: biotin--[acetyl-CoA-carboxylase] ligase [Thermoleophilia bacterium]|nr:biotin--[acetyl-CoA-carboxylase] ligase [Thermoleophilia bacterium]
MHLRHFFRAVSGLSPTDRLDIAVAQDLVTAGQARRVALALELLRTLPDAEVGTFAPGFAASVSGEALGGALGLSRAAVHKHVEHLRTLGFAIATVAGAGYRLERPFDDLVAAEAVLPCLLSLLPADPVWTAGLPYRHVAGCSSTNAELKVLAATAPAGTALVADEQTGGRGRLGRTWVSRRGQDLTFSVLLRPNLGPAQAHLLSLAAALAVAEVLEDLEGLEGRVAIKWPNDVLMGGRKVCGILLEGSMDADRLQWVVAGIGLNVNSDPEALLRGLDPNQEREWRGKPAPTSLHEELGHEISRAPLLARLLVRLTQRWKEVERPELLEGLQRRDVLVGRHVEVLSGPPLDEPVVSGEAVGIGPVGQLLVRVASGETVPVFAGDVTVMSLEPPLGSGVHGSGPVNPDHSGG